jgi:hypothetical protein
MLTVSETLCILGTIAHASKSTGPAGLEDAVVDVAAGCDTATDVSAVVLAVGVLIGAGVAGVLVVGGLRGSGTLEEPAMTWWPESVSVDL